jgi:ATP:ADP antiporter, AAA family
MRDRLFSLRGIESGEKHMVSMLLAQAVFLGIFIGAFDISAHSLFLSIYDEKILAKGYIVSGFTGMVLLSVYFYFQGRIKFRNFAFINLIAVAALTIILCISLLISRSEAVIFLVFVMLGPLNILAIIGFRSTAGSLSGLIKGQRLFAIVDIALITGLIISCFSVPLLLAFRFPLHHFLLISSLAITCSAIIQWIIRAGSVEAGINTQIQPGSFRRNISVLNIFRDDRYTRILAIFITLSVVSALFVQYSFLALTRTKFPAAVDMARFLGIFTGSVMIMTLFGKLLLFSWLLNKYGLRICLTVSPALLALFTIIAIGFGMFMGYTRETAGGFMIFFILLALIRFLSKSMDESIESPSFRLLYQTIDEKLRFGVQSMMDSTVKEAAAFLAGLILAGVGMLSFVRLIHFSWILFVMLFIWLFVAFRLYSEYRTSVKKNLESLKSDDTVSSEQNDQTVFSSRFYGERVFGMDYFNLVSDNFSVFEKMENKFYFQKIIDHTISFNDINLLPVVKKIAGRKSDKEIRKRSADIAARMEEFSSELKRENERIFNARHTLSETRMPQTTEILRLLRDKSLDSKKLAIYMIGKFRLYDMLPEVCECLNTPGLETDTVSVLKTFGNIAEEDLIRYYLVSSGNINTCKTILRLLSKLPLNEGSGFLFSRLWSNSRQLKEVAIRCLIDCRFKPSPEDRERLNLLISDIVGVITWNLSAKRCLEKNNDAVILAEIEKELGRWSHFLINILSVAYDAAVVTRIRKNLEFETVESVHYAHAIIDIIADDSIKAKIIYLLDVVPDDQKLRNLNRYFPVELPQYDKLLEDILNRDYNLIGLWIKACVLRYHKGIRDVEMAESVVALLFSPERILQEEATGLIARSDLRLYKSVSNRIPIATRRLLDRIINGEADKNELLFDKIRFLSECFTGIIEEQLLSLALKTSYAGNIKALMTSLPDRYILWDLSSENRNQAACILYSSDADSLPGNITGNEKASFYILSLKAVEEFLYQFPENADILLTYMENNEK